MIEIVNAVDELAEKEWRSKLDEKGPFISHDHAYRPILEELRETADALESASESFSEYNEALTEDDFEKANTKLKDIEYWAKNAAAEAVQLAGLCKKAVHFLEREGKWVLKFYAHDESKGESNVQD